MNNAYAMEIDDVKIILSRFFKVKMHYFPRVKSSKPSLGAAKHFVFNHALMTCS